jgi:hypothetical protein
VSFYCAVLKRKSIKYFSFIYLANYRKKQLVKRFYFITVIIELNQYNLLSGLLLRSKIDLIVFKAENVIDSSFLQKFLNNVFKMTFLCFVITNTNVLSSLLVSIRSVINYLDDTLSLFVCQNLTFKST